jgi:hypothetical protein
MLARSLTSLLLLSSLLCASGCGDEEVCDPLSVYRLDPEGPCYGDVEPAPDLWACRVGVPERGIAIECVRSPTGELYAAQRNAAASLESTSWAHGDQLDAAEKAACDRIMSAGFPSSERRCPTE